LQPLKLEDKNKKKKKPQVITFTDFEIIVPIIYIADRPIYNGTL